MKAQGEARFSVTPRVLLFLERDGRTLMIKGAAHKWWAGKLNGIGGSVEAGETIIEAARRETREETGVEPRTLHLAAVVSVMSAPPVLLFVFVGELSAGELRPTDEGTFHWLTVEELRAPALPVFEDFPFLWARLQQWRAGETPLYLLFDYREDFTGRESAI